MRKIIIYFFILTFAAVALAYVDDSVHWTVEVTSNWNAVYGTVTGIGLEEGDSVGMFDKDGNCYGAGLFDGEHFFLSAFMYEEANPDIPGDFAIPGFKEGEEVVFKVYKKNTDTPYVVTPASGQIYTYEYKGRYPPDRIDLVYIEEEGVKVGRGVSPDEPAPEGEAPLVSPGTALPSLVTTEAEEAEEEEEEETTPKIFAAASPEKEKAELYSKAQEEEYPAEERPSVAPEPRKYERPERFESRETKIAEAPYYEEPLSAEKEPIEPSPAPPVVKPAKKIFPIVVKILIISGIFALLVILAKKLGIF